MSDKQQKTDSRETEQQQLMAFATEGRSESPMTVVEGTVSLEVDSNLESPTSSDRLMERICGPLNFNAAIEKVIPNDGVPLFLKPEAKILPAEPPWYGPVRPVVWEEGSREASPYPDRSVQKTRRRPLEKVSLLYLINLFVTDTVHS